MTTHTELHRAITEALHSARNLPASPERSLVLDHLRYAARTLLPLTQGEEDESMRAHLRDHDTVPAPTDQSHKGKVSHEEARLVLLETLREYQCQLAAAQSRVTELEAELSQALLGAKNWKRNWEIASAHEVELESELRALRGAAAALVAEAVGPYDPPQRGSNLEKLYMMVRPNGLPVIPAPVPEESDVASHWSMGHE